MKTAKTVSLRLNPRQLWHLTYIREVMGWQDKSPGEALRDLIGVYAEELHKRDPEKGLDWRCPA